jgi:aconitate hydratase
MIAINYLRVGRSEEQIQLIETYLKEQGLFRTKNSPDPVPRHAWLDLGSGALPCRAGNARKTEWHCRM